MYKILVVDDDKISHAFIKRALLTRFVLTHTFSGEEALRLLAIEKPDLVLLDVEMPGLNGYAVCEQIKANPETADIPVLFLSARDELRDRIQGFDVGADDYQGNRAMLQC
jgi:CheY-like chemotaxis protein